MPASRLLTRIVPGRPRRALQVLLAATLAIGGLGLQGCLAQEKAVIAFLLASSQAERWTTVDEPVFRTYVDEACDGCGYVTYNAEQDADRQADQFEQAIDAGADVVVLNAVDTAAAAEWVAANPDVQVVAYDRFIEGAGHYVSVDPAVTGRLMAQTLVDAVGEDARVAMVEGGRGDENAREIAEAAEGVFARYGIEVVARTSPRSWSAGAAKSFILAEKDRLDRVDAVFASNDTQASGVVAALDELEVPATQRPYVTGQDAELAAVRRVISGDQGMTVYKQITSLAERAADLSIDLLAGVEPDDLSEHRGVPSVILEPSAVTRTTVADTVVRDRVHTLEQLCEGETSRACNRLGLR